MTVRRGHGAEGRWMVLFASRVSRLRPLLASAARYPYLSHLIEPHDEDE